MTTSVIETLDTLVVERGLAVATCEASETPLDVPDHHAVITLIDPTADNSADGDPAANSPQTQPDQSAGRSQGHTLVSVVKTSCSPARFGVFSLRVTDDGYQPEWHSHANTWSNALISAAAYLSSHA